MRKVILKSFRTIVILENFISQKRLALERNGQVGGYQHDQGYLFSVYRENMTVRCSGRSEVCVFAICGILMSNIN